MSGDQLACLMAQWLQGEEGLHLILADALEEHNQPEAAQVLRQARWPIPIDNGRMQVPNNGPVLIAIDFDRLRETVNRYCRQRPRTETGLRHLVGGGVVVLEPRFVTNAAGEVVPYKESA
jgi:hypothetical protein